jgi:hypothetical protein
VYVDTGFKRPFRPDRRPYGPAPPTLLGVVAERKRWPVWYKG